MILANPTAGRGRGRRLAREVAGHLLACGVEVTVRETAARGEAEWLASEACAGEGDRPTCVAGCGGDGTMAEVGNALAVAGESLGEDCPAMGLVPAGRCNDLARALGVWGNAGDVAAVLAGGEPSPIDLGWVNGRYFCTVATVGIDAEVTSYVDSMKMPLRGTAAYLYGAMVVLRRYRAPGIRLEGDFGVIERPIFLASSANTSSYGGAIQIAPDAVPTDGELDLCVIDAVSRLRALAIVASVLRVTHRARPEVQFIRTKRLRITAERELELWADGERIATTPAEIRIAPAALRVLLPRVSI